MNSPFSQSQTSAVQLGMLESELRTGLDLYWKNAKQLLYGGPVTFAPPSEEHNSLAQNFFSTLFLYSYWRADIPVERRVLYVAVNQCLRGMVTGCDNILDNEYKKTIETNLPEAAYRFRSVLDIMASDRILFAIVASYCDLHGLPLKVALEISSTSLQSLLESGVQEASEEGGVDELLRPEDVLAKVHHYKTGLLFACTWDIPMLLDQDIEKRQHVFRDALYRIGIGCQILDDIVDLPRDYRDRRHNYVASAIAHRESADMWHHVQMFIEDSDSAQNWVDNFPGLAAKYRKEAVSMLEEGFDKLFAKEHSNFIWPAILFIADRIGVLLVNSDSSR
jgi:hypothetical protein